MKLRFDFTKTDNTIMSSNVIDIPVSDCAIVDDMFNSFVNIRSTIAELGYYAANVVIFGSNTDSSITTPVLISLQVGTEFLSVNYAYIAYVSDGTNTAISIFYIDDAGAFKTKTIMSDTLVQASIPMQMNLNATFYLFRKRP